VTSDRTDLWAFIKQIPINSYQYRETMKIIQIALLLLATAVSAEEQRPNIVMILVDDFGRQDVGYHGSTFYDTPNIDSLSEAGMVFNNAYCSHPRCVPSRYGMMTGRIPSRDGIPGFPDRSSPHTMPLARVTFAERLKEAGYATGYIGKWHLGGGDGAPSGQGFDDSRIAGEAGAPNSYFYPFHESKSAKAKAKEQVFPVVSGREGEYLTDRLTDEAIDFVSKNKENPFLLVLAHYAVHTPFEGPEEMVKDARRELRKAGREAGGNNDDPDFKNADHATFKTEQNNPVYAAMVRSVDDSVGRVIKELETLGLDNDTMVILTSDHGGLSSRGETTRRPLATSNLPYRQGKGWLYEGGLRVPMIVKWPGHVKPGSSTDVQTINTDHYATIVEAAGLKTDSSEATDSMSYLPALNGESPDRGKMFFHSPRSRPSSTGDQDASALIDGKWKLFKHLDSGKLELYDLAKDPGETNDLASEMPEQVASMKASLEQIARDTNAREGGNNPFKGDRKKSAKQKKGKIPSPAE